MILKFQGQYGFRIFLIINEKTFDLKKQTSYTNHCQINDMNKDMNKPKK